MQNKTIIGPAAALSHTHTSNDQQSAGKKARRFFGTKFIDGLDDSKQPSSSSEEVWSWITEGKLAESHATTTEEYLAIDLNDCRPAKGDTSRVILL
jgi:hypothetical protein